MLKSSLIESSCLLVIDMQEKLFDQVENQVTVLETVMLAIQAFEILNIPLILMEQYPKGLGPTLEALQKLLKNNYQPQIKETFSCCEALQLAEGSPLDSYQNWILIGLEAHICVFQTAKELQQRNKNVIVLANGVSSHSDLDCSCALQEMQRLNIRVTTLETLLFEYLRTPLSPHFKSIQSLIKTSRNKKNDERS